MVCPYYQSNYGTDYLSACKIKDKHLELPNKLHLKILCLSKISFEWCAKYRKKTDDERRKR